jgi:Tfp pilus assembly protein PilO
MDLNNIQIDDIKEKLLSLDRGTVIRYASAFGITVVFLIIYYMILSPMVEQKKVQLDEMNLEKKEIIDFEASLISLKKKIKKIKPLYKKNSSLFHTREEVEGLYKTLSKYAGANGLTVSKINKQAPVPVKKNPKDKSKKLSSKNVAYYVIPVKFEIRGNFIGYIKFKRELANSKKMLNFEKEIIKVENNESGAIVISGELSIVGVTNEFL